MTEIQPERKLTDIAQDIAIHWVKMSHHARPYVAAMMSLTTIDDKYGLDSGTEIVARFLANAQTWRGGKARQIKNELNEMLNKRKLG